MQLPVGRVDRISNGIPLIATPYQAVAGIGPTVTLITSWATLALLSVTEDV